MSATVVVTTVAHDHKLRFQLQSRKCRGHHLLTRIRKPPTTHPNARLGTPSICPPPPYIPKPLTLTHATNRYAHLWNYVTIATSLSHEARRRTTPARQAHRTSTLIFQDFHFFPTPYHKNPTVTSRRLSGTGRSVGTCRYVDTLPQSPSNSTTTAPHCTRLARRPSSDRSLSHNAHPPRIDDPGVPCRCHWCTCGATTRHAVARRATTRHDDGHPAIIALPRPSPLRPQQTADRGLSNMDRVH